MKARGSNIAAILISLASIFFATSSVWATQAIPPSLAAMAELSDAIVTGSVREQYSYWEDDKIFTNVLVTIDQLVKDSPSGTAGDIELKILGGQVGEVRLEIDLAPSFQAGETVMLFLRESGLEHVPFAFHYGVFRILESETGGEPEVTGPLFKEPMRYDPLSMQASAESEETGHPKKLSDFIHQVQLLTK